MEGYPWREAIAYHGPSNVMAHVKLLPFQPANDLEIVIVEAQRDAMTIESLLICLAAAQLHRESRLRNGIGDHTRGGKRSQENADCELKEDWDSWKLISEAFVDATTERVDELGARPLATGRVHQRRSCRSAHRSGARRHVHR